MEENQAIINTSSPSDRISSTKTMYDVGAWEIFIKNFIAGAGRAFGNIVLYLLFFGIIVNIFIKIILPQLQPFITEYREALEPITRLNSATEAGDKLDPNQYQKFIQDLNSSLPISK